MDAHCWKTVLNKMDYDTQVSMIMVIGDLKLRNIIETTTLSDGFQYAINFNQLRTMNLKFQHKMETKIDFSKFDCPNLTTICASNVGISNLYRMASITYLDCYDCDIAMISLHKYPLLNVIKLHDCKIDKILIGKNECLREINWNKFDAKYLAFMATECPNVEKLIIYDCRNINNIRFKVRKFKHLKEFECNAGFFDFSEMHKLKSLMRLKIYDEVIVDVSQLTWLTHFDCGSSFGFIGIECLKNLICLGCTYYEGTIDVSGMQQLEKLDCYKCFEIKGLEKLENLTSLDCAECEGIHSFAKLTKLRELTCGGQDEYMLKKDGGVKYDGFENLLNMRYMVCMNVLTHIDVSKMKKIKSLQYVGVHFFDNSDKLPENATICEF